MTIHPCSVARSGPTLPRIASTDGRLRRYSLARRGALPRDDRTIAVEGLWAHRTMAALDLGPELFLWSSGPDPAPPEVARTVRDVVLRAAHSFEVAERVARRIHPGVGTPALLSTLRLDVRPPAPPTGSATRSLVLVADGIEYAGNLGTLIRTADACGADAVVLSACVVRPTHPKVFVASRGTVATMPLVELGNAEDARRWLLERGYRIVVADPAGASHYLDADYSGPTAIVVGAEGAGLHPVWRGSPSTVVSIPMLGRADSLNVGVSAAVLLFAACSGPQARPSGRRSDQPAMLASAPTRPPIAQPR